MIAKTEIFVEKLKLKIHQWDSAFDQFQIKEYPSRLLAQVQYRKQIEALKAKRRLVEERLLNFEKRMEWPLLAIPAGFDPVRWFASAKSNAAFEDKAGMT